MKTCSVCETEYEATAENFSPNRYVKSGLQSQCRVCRRAAYKKWSQSTEGKRYYQSSRIKEYRKVYRGSIRGYLHGLYGSIKQRCGTIGLYTSIECKFESSDDLINHVINDLKIDPRGKQIHRIDNEGHYELENIEFLTRKEHDRVHVELRKNKLSPKA